MPDYQNGKIYKLWSPSKNLVYYGSTTQTLSQRLASHIRDNKRENHQCISKLVLECEDYKIELVEEYPCNNKQQLERKEGEYQKNNECVNINVAGRTRAEWRKDNYNKVLEHRKKYSEEHREYNRLKAKKYREDNRDEINERRRNIYLEKKELKDKLKDKL